MGDDLAGGHGSESVLCSKQGNGATLVIAPRTKKRGAPLHLPREEDAARNNAIHDALGEGVAAQCL